MEEEETCTLEIVDSLTETVISWVSRESGQVEFC